jgi:8-oxo-dGTP diphosphatase
VVLRDREGRVLVIRRGPRARRSGYWAPPSGELEPGESTEQAIIREMREETGLDVAPGAKVWECATDDGRYRLHWWTAGALSRELRLDPGEAAEGRWVSADEFAALSPIFPAHLEFFRNVLPTLSQPPPGRTPE